MLPSEFFNGQDPARHIYRKRKKCREACNSISLWFADEKMAPAPKKFYAKTVKYTAAVKDNVRLHVATPRQILNLHIFSIFNGTLVIAEGGKCVRTGPPLGYYCMDTIYHCQG